MFPKDREEFHYRYIDPSGKFLSIKLYLFSYPSMRTCVLGASREPSHGEGSFEYPIQLFQLRIKKNKCPLGTLILSPVDIIYKYIARGRECSGSVVECLTRDQGVAGLSLTGITALLHINPCLVLVQPRKTHPNKIEHFPTENSHLNFSEISQKFHRNISERILQHFSEISLKFQ